MLKFLLRPFFSTVLIGVNLDAKVCSLKIVVLKNGHVKSSVSKEFKIVNKELPMEAAKLIADYKRKYPFTYLSAMSKTYNQGLANCSKKGELIKFGVNAKTSHIIEMPNHWLFYIQQLAVDENRVKFIRALGLDYLFSPFVLVYESIKGRLTEKVRLYVLQERASITLFVADKKGVYFGGFFMVGGELENNEDKGASMLEIHSAKEMSDLDSIQKQQEAEMSRLEGLRDLARASNATEILKNSINEFYSNPIYNSTQFIETIVLLDTYGMTEQAVAHIRNTLMIEVEVRSIHIPDALIDLAKAELKDNRG